MPELEQRVKKLEEELAQFKNLATLDPQMKRTIKLVIAQEFVDDGTYNENDYDRSVDEAGSGTYQVPNDFDGVVLVGGKLIGYYNP